MCPKGGMVSRRDGPGHDVALEQVRHRRREPVDVARQRRLEEGAVPADHDAPWPTTIFIEDW
jgi:hypothetical protein